MTDHDSPQRYIEITRARCIARYRMHSIPGIPEELETNVEIDGGKRRISFAYAGGEMRLRKHGGPTNRQWVDTRDFRLRDNWLDEVYEFLDDFLGVVVVGIVSAIEPNTAVRPITPADIANLHHRI